MRKVAHIFHTECLSWDRYWDQLRRWYPGVNVGRTLSSLTLLEEEEPCWFPFFGGIVSSGEI